MHEFLLQTKALLKKLTLLKSKRTNKVLILHLCFHNKVLTLELLITNHLSSDSNYKKLLCYYIIIAICFLVWQNLRSNLSAIRHWWIAMKDDVYSSSWLFLLFQTSFNHTAIKSVWSLLDCLDKFKKKGWYKPGITIS